MTPHSPVDLHLHSTASDGMLDPAALVAHVAARSVKLMSLTDHDTVAGVDARPRRPRGPGPGVRARASSVRRTGAGGPFTCSGSRSTRLAALARALAATGAARGAGRAHRRPAGCGGRAGEHGARCDPRRTAACRPARISRANWSPGHGRRHGRRLRPLAGPRHGRATWRANGPRLPRRRRGSSTPAARR